MNIWFYIWLGTTTVSITFIILIWRTMSVLLEENLAVKQLMVKLYQYYEVLLGKLNNVDKFGAFAEHDDFGKFFTIIRQSLSDLKDYFSVVKTKDLGNEKEK